MENQFNEQESLQLIKEMITQARTTFQKGRGDSLVFWGYFIAVLALANFILLRIFENQSWVFWVWALTLPVSIVNAVIGHRKEKKALVKNHINSLIGYIWFAYFITIVCFLMSIFAIAFGLEVKILFLLINPVIIGMSGLALFVTGRVCRFQPYVYGAVLFWTGAVVSAFIPVVFGRIDYQFVVLALCLIMGFVIPGHILNSKTDTNV
jgi:hypothetical protein